jgi:hypothetical protein
MSYRESGSPSVSPGRARITATRALLLIGLTTFLACGDYQVVTERPESSQSPKPAAGSEAKPASAPQAKPGEHTAAQKPAPYQPSLTIPKLDFCHFSPSEGSRNDVTRCLTRTYRHYVNI